MKNPTPFLLKDFAHSVCENRIGLPISSSLHIITLILSSLHIIMYWDLSQQILLYKRQNCRWMRVRCHQHCSSKWSGKKRIFHYCRAQKIPSITNADSSAFSLPADSQPLYTKLTFTDASIPPCLWWGTRMEMKLFWQRSLWEERDPGDHTFTSIPWLWPLLMPYSDGIITYLQVSWAVQKRS